MSLGEDEAADAGKPAKEGQGEVTMRARAAALVALVAASLFLASPRAAERAGNHPISSAPRSRSSRRSASPSASG